ncbi:ATP-binding protein [Janibacter melonis]|uniref:ATP-binding protein n=1 Tax=Janibacter melonis TaxID=262209 RepID=UPI0019192BE3|nr:ATP-binding protein [Janibacter melonis]
MCNKVSQEDATMRNPYTPGELPRVLAGREDQQHRIRGVLSRVSAYGETGGPPVVFLGPRGVGKTSLLREAQRDADEHGFLTVWVSCHHGAPFLPDLVSRVDHALRAADVVAKGDRRSLRLDEIAVEIGVPTGVKVSARAAPDEGGGAETGARVSALEDLLHGTATRVRERGGSGLLVLVDELHAPSRTDLAVLLNAMQNLAGGREDSPFALVCAGLPSSVSVLTRAATFAERSTFVTLPPLAPEAAAQAVGEPAEQLGVGWTGPALAEVVERAQGFPYLLQVLAHATWQSASPVAGDRLGVADVRAGLPLVEAQLDAMFAARWGAATPLEQHLLTVMAHAGSASVTRAEIAAGMGRSTQSLGMPRERLIDKGIVEPAGHGRLRFTMPGFAEYLRATTATGEASRPST